MKRIGLTGNIGTGKSTVARVFEVLGIPVYYADKHARLILDSGIVIKQVVSLFGEQVLNSRQQIDRKKLAAIVFTDKRKLTSLNDLIHPLVETSFADWCESHADAPYVLHEAAILFESGFDRLFDANILVTAPEQLCVSRVMNRDGLSREMVLDRMQNQWSQEKKIQLSDYSIVNDEVLMIIPQVLAIHNIILSI